VENCFLRWWIECLREVSGCLISSQEQWLSCAVSYCRHFDRCRGKGGFILAPAQCAVRRPISLSMQPLSSRSHLWGSLLRMAILGANFAPEKVETPKWPF
jgi:hypothetical protein